MDTAQVVTMVPAILTLSFMIISWIKDRKDKRFEKLEKKIENLAEKIDKRFDQVHLQLEEIKESIHGLDNRVVYLEAKDDFISPINSSKNKRSESAKLMWKKRREVKHDTADTV